MQTMNVLSSRGTVVARFRIALHGLSHIMRVGTDEARSIMPRLRALPREFVSVDVEYPSISRQSFPFNTGVYMLDLPDNAPELNSEESIQTDSAHVLYVCPHVDKLPNDGFLEYASFEVFTDLFKLEPRTVVMVREDQLHVLKVVQDYGPVVGITIRCITGIPEADYSVTFTDATWAFEKIAYAPFIADLSSAVDTQEQIKNQLKGGVADEEARYTRKDGSVKEHSKFIGPNEEEAEVEEFRL